MIAPDPRDRIDPQPVKLAKVLAVEGKSDAFILEELAKTLNLQDQIEIRPYNGKNKLEAFLSVLVTTAGFSPTVTSLGIVHDSDDDPAESKRAVEQAIAATQIPAHVVQVSFMIVPDENTIGMMESLCLGSVQDRPVFQCIAGFEECVRQQGHPLPNTAVLAKHRAQLFLATQPEVQFGPGLAATKGYWPLDHAVFNPLKRFLQNL